MLISLDGMYISDPLPLINQRPEELGVRRDVPGVAFWHTKDVGLPPAELRTPAAKNWYRKAGFFLLVFRRS